MPSDGPDQVVLPALQSLARYVGYHRQPPVSDRQIGAGLVVNPEHRQAPDVVEKSGTLGARRGRTSAILEISTGRLLQVFATESHVDRQKSWS